MDLREASLLDRLIPLGGRRRYSLDIPYPLDRALADLRFVVLTWVSIYWFSLSGPAASVRIYYELKNTGGAISFPKTTVPVGISFFPKELAKFPRAYVPIFMLSLSHGPFDVLMMDIRCLQHVKNQSQDRIRVGTRIWGSLCGVRKAGLARWRPEEDVWQVRTCGERRIWVHWLLIGSLGDFGFLSSLFGKHPSTIRQYFPFCTDTRSNRIVTFSLGDVRAFHEFR